MILQTSDFIGVYKISNDNFSQLVHYIEQFEPKYLKAILGDDNYTSIDSDATVDKYSDLLNEGLKEALIAFVYFHYVSDNFVNTTIGNVYNNNENSQGVGNKVNAQICINRFNAGVDLVNEKVYDYCDDYYDVKTTITSSSEVAGVYTCLVPTTKYLNIGTNVTIENVEYEVTDVIDDTSFTISTSVGLDFSNKAVLWQPYYGITVNKLDEIVI